MVLLECASPSLVNGVVNCASLGSIAVTPISALSQSDVVSLLGATGSALAVAFAFRFVRRVLWR